MSLASKRWLCAAIAWPALVLIYLLAFEPYGSGMEKDAVVLTFERWRGGLIVIVAAPVIGWLLWGLYLCLVSAPAAERT